jgi:hypothetical protein
MGRIGQYRCAVIAPAQAGIVTRTDVPAWSVLVTSIAPP